MSFIPVTWEAKEDLHVKASMDNLMIDPQNKMLKVDVLIVKVRGQSHDPHLPWYVCMFSIAGNSVKGTYCYVIPGNKSIQAEVAPSYQSLTKCYRSSKPGFFFCISKDRLTLSNCYK